MADTFGLYLVLTDPATSYEACTEAAVAEGVRYVQLRMKHAERAEIIDAGRRLRAITAGSGTRFIVNDDVQIAAEIDADGVHLGQDDMPLAEARELWPVPGKLFGLSTHNEQQAGDAEPQRPDYIGVGPIFPTPTKDMPDPQVGPARMGAIIGASPLTAVAIGGINGNNLREVLAAGAVNFAVVRAVTQSENPRSAIAELMQIWRDALSR
jgi:thiamine-phosphate pyrophosphorylase